MLAGSHMLVEQAAFRNLVCLNLGSSYLETFKANDSEHILPNVKSLSVFSEGNSNT